MRKKPQMNTDKNKIGPTHQLGEGTLSITPCHIRVHLCSSVVQLLLLGSSLIREFKPRKMPNMRKERKLRRPELAPAGSIERPLQIGSVFAYFAYFAVQLRRN